MPKLFFVLALLTGLAAPIQAADLRCQGDLMTPGTIVTKVRAKCGEPKWEDRVGEITVIRDGRERTLYITEMTYEVGSGYYVLTFEGGELKKTEYYQH
ncbi:MAG: DUF2845 domain-containing protein [Deltaproteobacteria bacterium]|nr:DUF2845 domain-containing protein [Deltaproteobacteria bacterium]